MDTIVSALKAFLRFMGISLAIALGVLAVMSLSCLVGTRCDNTAYSERVFWAGLIIVLAGMPAVLAMLGTSQGYYNSPFTAGQDAKVALTIVNDGRRSLDKRTKFALRAGSIGAMCIGFAALIDRLG